MAKLLRRSKQYSPLRWFSFNRSTTLLIFVSIDLRLAAHRFIRPPWRILFIAWFVGFSGCNGSSGTYPVAGTVKQANGQPLTGGSVVFQPVAPPARAARGIIASDGSFRLRTFEDSDGALPAVYKVTVFPAIPEDALDDANAIARIKSTIDRRYQNADTTPLEFTVTADSSANHFDITLQPLAKK
jgi:hypothetical protein